MLGTIQKASDVLDLFTSDKHEWGVTEIAVRFGEPKSTVHELLSSLAQIGWLSRTDRGRYRLGRRFLTYSGVLLKVPQYGEEARRQLQGLVARFGNSAYLALLDQFDVVIADSIEAIDTQAHSPSYVGVRIPAHSNSFGQVLLAYVPWDAVSAEVNKNGLQAFTANTITSIDQLQSELAGIRESGYAISVNERAANRTNVAAPVRDQAGEVVASIGVVMDSAAFEPVRDEVVSAVTAAARALSTSLGYQPKSADSVDASAEAPAGMLDGAPDTESASETVSAPEPAPESAPSAQATTEATATPASEGQTETPAEADSSPSDLSPESATDKVE